LRFGPLAAHRLAVCRAHAAEDGQLLGVLDRGLFVRVDRAARAHHQRRVPGAEQQLSSVASARLALRKLHRGRAGAAVFVSVVGGGREGRFVEAVHVKYYRISKCEGQGSVKNKLCYYPSDADSPEHDVSLPAMRRGVGEANRRSAQTLREVQNALLERGEGKAGDGTAEEEGGEKGEVKRSGLVLPAVGDGRVRIHPRFADLSNSASPTFHRIEEVQGCGGTIPNLVHFSK
jgi:hypothetical protein